MFLGFIHIVACISSSLFPCVALNKLCSLIKLHCLRLKPETSTLLLGEPELINTLTISFCKRRGVLEDFYSVLKQKVRTFQILVTWGKRGEMDYVRRE